MNVTGLSEITDMMLSSTTTFNLAFTPNVGKAQPEVYRYQDIRLKIIQLYVEPVIGILGIIANILTFFMLAKSGLRKPPNIVIFGLTLADCLLLISTVNGISLVGRFVHSKETANYFGWECPENLDILLSTVNRILLTLHNWGGFAGTGIPVVRFIAVFFPMKFRGIVTRKRASFLVVSVWVFWAPWALVSAFTREFRFKVLPSGTPLGYEVLSEMYMQNFEILSALNHYFFNFLSSIVPISLVCVGCALIGVRVKYTQRKKVAGVVGEEEAVPGNDAHAGTISMIFAIIHSTYFTLTCVTTDEYQNGTNFTLVLDDIKNILVYVCGSFNFFVYVLLNRKFRNILVDKFMKKY